MAHLEEVQVVRLDHQRDMERLQDLLQVSAGVRVLQEIMVLHQLLLVTLVHPALTMVLQAQQGLVDNREVDLEGVKVEVVGLGEVPQLQVTMPHQLPLHLVNMVLHPELEDQEDLTEVLVELKEDTVVVKEVKEVVQVVLQEDTQVVTEEVLEEMEETEDTQAVMEEVLEETVEMEDMDKKKTTHQCHTTLPMPSRTTTETTTTVRKLVMDQLSMVNTEFCFPMGKFEPFKFCISFSILLCSFQVSLYFFSILCFAFPYKNITVVLKSLLTLLTGKTVSMPK